MAGMGKNSDADRRAHKEYVKIDLIDAGDVINNFLNATRQ